jgi:ribonuclease-3
VEAIFRAKSERTKMEEEPTMLVPDTEQEQQDFIIANDSAEKTDSVELDSAVETSADSDAVANSPLDVEFDLSDITHKEKSREDIIAEAEAAAFAEE